MSTAQIKKNLHKYVDNLDVPFLQAVYNLVKTHVDENTVIGYSAKGKTITARELRKRVKTAQSRMDKGQFISHEDVEKEAASW